MPSPVTPGMPLRSSRAGVSRTPAATHTTRASIVTRSPAARVSGCRRTPSMPRTVPASDADALGAGVGEDAGAGTLRPRHVGEQRRLLGAARAAEVAQPEVDAASYAARSRLRRP